MHLDHTKECQLVVTIFLSRILGISCCADVAVLFVNLLAINRKLKNADLFCRLSQYVFPEYP